MDSLNPTLIVGMESTNTIVGFVLLDFIFGILSVLVYACIRPRFAPGAGTALKAGLLVWGVSAATMAFICIMGIFPTGLYLMSAAGALVNSLVSTVVGARFYTET